MKYIILGAAALFLSACAGLPGGDRCTQAQAALAQAQATIVQFQVQFPDQAVPEELLTALAFANQAMPIFCPAPALVIE